MVFLVSVLIRIKLTILQKPLAGNNFGLCVVKSDVSAVQGCALKN